MADDTVQIRFGAETSGVAAGASEVKTQLAGLHGVVADLATGFKSLAGTAVAGFSETSAGGKAAATAVDLLVKWTEQMGEGGEKVRSTAQALGTSVGAVQQLGAAFNLMGIDTERGVQSVGQLDRAFATAREGGKQQSSVFKALGVDVAKTYTQMQLLGAVMDGFKAQADGPAKAAEALALFGHSGAELIPFLDLGASGMARLNEVTRRYGVANADSAAKSAALGAALAENQVALSGLGDVLAREFAPALTVALQGVNEGFQAIKLVVASLSDTWRLVVDTTTERAQQLGDSFVGLGRVIYDALTNNLLNAARDMKSAEDRMASDVAASSARIRRDLALSGKDAAPDWNKMGGDAAAHIKFVGGLGDGRAAASPIPPSGQGAAAASAGAPAARTSGGDTSQMEAWQGDLRDAEEAMRARTGAWLADMQAFELQFWQGKLAAAGASSKDYQQLVEKVDELTLATHKAAAERQLADDKKTIESRKGNWAEELAALRQYVADATKLYAQGSQGAKEAAATEAEAVSQHAKETAEAQIRAVDELGQAQQRQATRAIELAKASADAQIAAVKQLYDLGEISARSYFARIEALHGQDTSAQVAALQQQLTQISANYAAQLVMKGQTEAQLGALDGKYLNDLMGVQAKILQVSQAGSRQLIADQNEAILKVKAQWDGFVDPLVTTFSDGLLKMAEGTRSFRQTMLDLGQNLLQDMTRNVARLVERWLWGEIGRKLATIETNNNIVASNATAATQSASINALANLKKIQSDAAAAGAAAYKAMAGIPPAPLWGIAAGAAAYAGVMAFEGLASAAGGFDIPSGVNPITQLHQREMVLPASIANPMRSFFGGAGAPTAAAIAGGVAGPSASGRTGDAHLYYAPTINAPAQQSLRQMLTDQGADMISFVQAAIRNRSLKFA